MRAWMIASSLMLLACGSAPAPEQTTTGQQTAFVPPDAVLLACSSAQRATSIDICFSGVDYTSFPPGSIFRVGSDGAVSTVFQRAHDSLTSYAQAPDGTVYFTNAVNGMAVYKIDGSGESIVYQHTTYVRMVRVDSHGQVYFNESTGAGRDGVIYKLVDGVAQVFYTVKLGSVLGFWGDFGFDFQDRLWLSSSNIIPSRLFVVDGGAPQPVYLSESSAFMGFRFVSPTEILFAGQDKTLRLLDLCKGTARNVFDVPAPIQAQDVNACPSAVPDGKMTGLSLPRVGLDQAEEKLAAFHQ